MNLMFTTRGAPAPPLSPVSGQALDAKMLLWKMEIGKGHRHLAAPQDAAHRTGSTRLPHLRSVFQGLFQGLLRPQVQSHAGQEPAHLSRREGSVWAPGV